MCTSLPYWDVSWLVAVIFTIGSVIWVINGFFAWLPFVEPSIEEDDVKAANFASTAGWSAFIGATIFEIGSVLLMFEAVNENRAGCFGWALEQVFEDAEKGVGWKVSAEKRCRHHHSNKGNFVGKGHTDSTFSSATATGITSSNISQKRITEGAPDTPESVSERKPSDPSTPYTDEDSGRSWQWFPSKHDLLTHYIYELGFLACSCQMFGASVFWIAGITSMPPIYSILIQPGNQIALNFAYWFPQIVGGTGFIASGLCFMVETQRKWWVPAPRVLGWHVGLWNLIGAVGFTLCGALGPAYASSGAQYQAGLSSFWGSWAFLIGSLIQWYECLDTHPVEERKAKKGEGEGIGEANGNGNGIREGEGEGEGEKGKRRG